MAKKTTQGVDVDRLDQLIKDLGVRVKVWKSSVCPNVQSLESLDHDVNCTECNNNMIDFDPVDTIAMFQQQDFHESFKVMGTFHVDEVLVSFLSGITLQRFTRVELLDFEEDFFELVQRQDQATTNIDVLKYPACRVLGIFAIRNGVRERFHEGADFTLDQDGNIKWVGAHKPNDREIYTIYYKYRPVYRTIKAVHRERFSQFNTRVDNIKAPKKTIDGKTFVKMPETWVLKRDYLVKRREGDKSFGGGAQGAPIPPNEYYDPNE